MKAQLLTMSTPDGPFTIIARDGAVLSSGWTAHPGELTGQIHPDLLPAEFETVAGLGAISEAVEAFYSGNPEPAMGVPVLQKSGAFRSHAWDVLRTVAPGRPVTYTEYAQLSGNAKAVRAAASACAFNAAALFVPCHRVIRTDGTLGGFRWDWPSKAACWSGNAKRPSRRPVHKPSASVVGGHSGRPGQQLRKVDAVGRRRGAQAAQRRRAAGEPRGNVRDHAVDNGRLCADADHHAAGRGLKHKALASGTRRQEIEEVLAEGPAPGFRSAAGAEVGGVDDSSRHSARPRRTRLPRGS